MYLPHGGIVSKVATYLMLDDFSVTVVVKTLVNSMRCDQGGSVPKEPGPSYSHAAARDEVIVVFTRPVARVVFFDIVVPARVHVTAV
jgi:hypothetical protein